MEKEIIEIVNVDGSIENVELVTYLISDDKLRKYIVYTKGEVQGEQGDQIIYISKVISESNSLKLEEIIDDSEWSEVQVLLKKIANAK